MSAPLRRRRRLTSLEDRLLDPEVWETPRCLSPEDGFDLTGADWRSTRPVFSPEVDHD
jgi:hypothetical protein